jgi:CxxC motif-containing protein (DUF1111 family)
MPTAPTALSRRSSLIVSFLAVLAISAVVPGPLAQAAATDPGPRGGPAGAGGALPGLGAAELKFFKAALAQFITIDSVTGSIDGESGSGLGPRFNGNVCSGCHVHPAIGGSSPKVNPQVAFATLDGAKNVIPSFISRNGPIREARFLRNKDGSPDNSVHQLFTVTGRSDAKGCVIEQPDFADQLRKHNVALRIPSGLFGLGLVENVRDAGLVGADAEHAKIKAALGIATHFNRDLNDNSISRFGWKAQNKSLLIFSGEAYNVEQGVSNELFPNELNDNPHCRFTNQAEDATFFNNTINSGSAASDLSSAAVNFAGFMRFLAPPTPAPATASSTRGHQIFVNIGCEACHFETLQTTKSIYTGQGNVIFHPFSDFQIHDMGTRLADGIVLTNASGSQFRTAPLWGVGQRLFFLHDGRARDLLTAIQDHQSQGSEANTVITKFNALTPAQAQDLLNFLRSL